MAERIAPAPPLMLPDMCCCCLAKTEATYLVSGKTHEEFGFVMTTRWRLPLCSRCHQRLEQTKSRQRLAILALCVVGMAAPLSYARFGGWSILILLAAAIAGGAALWRNAVRTPAIVGWSLLDELQDSAHVDTRFGLVPICQLPRFDNQEYGRQFRELNGIERLRAVRVEAGRSEAEAHHAFSSR